MSRHVHIDCCVDRKRPALTALPRTVKQTWKGSIAKAGDDNQYDWLLALADSQRPKVRRAFLRALERIRGSIDEARLRDALSRRDMAGVLNVLGLDQGLNAGATADLVNQLEDTIIDTGRATPENSVPATSARIGMRFDIANPKAQEFIRNYNFALIRDISDKTRDGIKQVVSNAFEFGGHPYEQARIIRESIGLTDNQAAAVENFRQLLLDSDREALRRGLRDRRFDPTLDRALGRAAETELSPEQIERMVSRYRERMISARAENIARTETLRASNAGQDLAWQQAADNGLLDRAKFRSQWLVVPDDRLCIYCAAVVALNPGGVPLGAMFQTPLGPVLFPPLHPRCRCTRSVLVF